MRFLVRQQPLTSIVGWWGTSSHGLHLCLIFLLLLDVSAAFSNAPLPAGRVVVLRPPAILYELKLLPQGHVWLVHKAIYGLREAPSLWSEERTDALTNSTFASEGESYAVILSQVHNSLCLIVKQQSLQDHLPSTDSFGLTSRVLLHQVVALCGT